MAEEIRYEDFLMAVSPEDFGFVGELHDLLLGKGCDVKIQDAKSGYVVSYTLNKKTVLNYVFRKKGLMIRIYGDSIGQYTDLLHTLPATMKKAIQKASVCRRLLDMTKCNARCPMGYVFELEGKEYKKCRYSGFMFFLSEKDNPYIKAFVEKELQARCA